MGLCCISIHRKSNPELAIAQYVSGSGITTVPPTTCFPAASFCLTVLKIRVWDGVDCWAGNTPQQSKARGTKNEERPLFIQLLLPSSHGHPSAFRSLSGLVLLRVYSRASFIDISETASAKQWDSRKR